MSGGSIKFMTYNVLSCERVAVYRRIKSICEIIEQHDPDVIFLQEVTNYIYKLFQEAPWWGTYLHFIPPSNYNYLPSSNPPAFNIMLSKMDAREVAFPRYNEPVGIIRTDLLSAWVYTNKRQRLRAATCRLPSPSPSSIGYEHRRERASAFLKHFDVFYQPNISERSFVLDENVVLGGDLGWDDDVDGPLPLGDGGWVDAWQELRGSEADGWTYDALANPMLRALNLPVECKRPDRFICKLKDFTLDSIQMIGVDAIPGVTLFDDKRQIFVPVRPSRHFGLVLTIKPKHI